MSEVVKSNKAVLDSLNSLTNYASQIETRLDTKSDEEKKKEDDFVKKYLQQSRSLREDLKNKEYKDIRLTRINLKT